MSRKGAKSRTRGRKLHLTEAKARVGRARKTRADLERQLKACKREIANARERLIEATKQQTATSKMLRIISDSPLQSVLDARAFDVTVMSRSDVNAAGACRRAIKSALFESGRPVLLSPPDAPTSIAKNIFIHWNGSTEQARVNAFAMPLLRLAERVTVLSVIGGQEVPGPSADQIVEQLQHNEIAAKLMSVELEDRSTSEAVLDAAREQGCDLLVKGAFTRNRLRQMIFGGATSHIMEHADVPVLMAH